MNLTTLYTPIARIQALRLWGFLIFATGGLGLLANWLLVPVWWHPYVRVAGSAVTVTTHCLPRQVELETATPYAVLRSGHLVSTDPEHMIRQALEADTREGKEARQLILTLPSASRDKLVANPPHLGSGAGFEVTLDLLKIPAIDITRVTLTPAMTHEPGCAAPQVLEGETLMTSVVQPAKRLMRYRLIEDEISERIFRINEIMGNLVLGGLLIWTAWLLAHLIGGFMRYYLTSDGRFRTQLVEEMPESEKAPDDWICTRAQGQYDLDYRRFAFARVLGPALGFFLTVSSLVAGLHPSVTAAQDTARFISSLQLALVATFMGLLVRITAEGALRYARANAQRAVDVAPSFKR